MTTIETIRHRIAAMRYDLDRLEQDFELLVPSAEPVDDGVHCPKCDWPLDESAKYNTMGAQYQQYACPHCPFRGEIAGG